MSEDVRDAIIITEKIIDELFNALGKELKKSQGTYLDALENDDTLDPPIFVESP